TGQSSWAETIPVARGRGIHRDYARPLRQQASLPRKLRRLTVGRCGSGMSTEALVGGGRVDMKKVAESRQHEHSFGRGTRLHDTQFVSVGLELELDLDEHIEAAGVDERQFGAVDRQVRVVRDGVDNGQLECRYGEPVDFAAEV